MEEKCPTIAWAYESSTCWPSFLTYSIHLILLIMKAFKKYVDIPKGTLILVYCVCKVREQKSTGVPGERGRKRSTSWLMYSFELSGLKVTFIIYFLFLFCAFTHDSCDKYNPSWRINYNKKFNLFFLKTCRDRNPFCHVSLDQSWLSRGATHLYKSRFLASCYSEGCYDYEFASNLRWKAKAFFMACLVEENVVSQAL